MMRLLTAVLLILMFLPLSARADQTIDYEGLGAWPVLHEGRIKTTESLAKAILYDLSGSTSVGDFSAMEWLAVTLFEPSEAVRLPVIRIERQNLIRLPDRESHLYSLNEVMEALRPVTDQINALERMEVDKLSASQREILRVYNGVTILSQLLQSFSAVLPLAGEEGSYADGSGSEAQRALIGEAGQINGLYRIIPDPNNPRMPMQSVWEAYTDNPENPLVIKIKDMAFAWNEGRYDDWSALATQVEDELWASLETPFSLKLESYYNAVNPMMLAIGFYLIGAALLFWRAGIGMSVLTVGAAVHLAGLIARVLILMRPPTGTIYETLLFAAFIIIGAGLAFNFKNKNKTVLAAWACASAFLLFIAKGFVGGDSLNVLVAVLNTNFWLSTHVTCIIIGYAACVMAAVTGHLYLLQGYETLRKLMTPMALIALLFTAIGTLLGGIWADQSWGRFWGWDPKENGALLITLWLIWILHARISRHFNQIQFAAFLGLTNIMVAITWFGVNLLGVGLHSYGFISGIAIWLGVFCLVQLAVIGGLYRYRMIKDRHA